MNALSDFWTITFVNSPSLRWILPCKHPGLMVVREEALQVAVPSTLPHPQRPPSISRHRHSNYPRPCHHDVVHRDSHRHRQCLHLHALYAHRHHHPCPWGPCSIYPVHRRPVPPPTIRLPLFSTKMVNHCVKGEHPLPRWQALTVLVVVVEHRQLSMAQAVKHNRLRQLRPLLLPPPLQPLPKPRRSYAKCPKCLRKRTVYSTAWAWRILFVGCASTLSSGNILFKILKRKTVLKKWRTRNLMFAIETDVNLSEVRECLWSEL